MVNLQIKYRSVQRAIFEMQNIPGIAANFPKKQGQNIHANWWNSWRSNKTFLLEQNPAGGHKSEFYCGI